MERKRSRIPGHETDSNRLQITHDFMDTRDEHINDKAYLIAQAHDEMIQQLCACGIKDSQVLNAMKHIPRHHFIPKPWDDVKEAYGDHPVKIGYHQTISQPYIVAYMSERLDVRDGDKVLEIGTGSGYQTAILASLGATVYSVEIVSALAEFAACVLRKEGFGNSIRLKHGDGYEGWAEHGPYQAIIATCAPEIVPPSLISQLDDQGRLLLPLGVNKQRLVKIQKRGDKITRHDELPVRFVPMVH